MSIDKNKHCHPKVAEACYELNPCELTTTKFINMVEEFDTNGYYSFSRLMNTSLTKTVMYFVQNLGRNKVIAHLQVSPDGINFINEPTKVSPVLNQLKFIVPCIFAKFTRVAVKNINHFETSTVKIWYQAQE